MPKNLIIIMIQSVFEMDTRLKLVCLLFLKHHVYAEDPVVETKLGTIRGVRSFDGTIDMFMGIPYARVNESNPFGASIPHAGFDNVFVANDDTSICPQIEEFNNTLVGDLDCLRLNVYTPGWATSNSKLPVFFWIYGGGFNIGFYGRYMYGPKFLVRHDVILVTINYRLGPFGFMCLNIPEVPGNQGLKDTLLALRWVQQHIESFGGDPSRVTIGGNSAGGVAADLYLLRKPDGEILFQNAILQSGTAKMMMYGEPDRNIPITLANHFGHETGNIYAAIEFLASVPPLNIIQAASTLNINTFSCIEKEFEGVEAFFSESLATATHHTENVSVMIGIMDDEGFSSSMSGINHPSIVSMLLYNVFDTQHDDFTGTRSMENFYFGDQEPGEATIRSAVNVLGDIIFNYPTYRTIAMLRESDVKNLYFYMFAHDGGRNFVKYRENLVGGGATHADELGYLFDMELMPEEPTPEDQLVIDKMTTMWANFIKYGDPTPQVTDLLHVKWEPISKTSSLHCMVIATELSLTSRPFHDRMTFLDLLYEINAHLERTV